MHQMSLAAGAGTCFPSRDPYGARASQASQPFSEWLAGPKNIFGARNVHENGFHQPQKGTCSCTLVNLTVTNCQIVTPPFTMDQNGTQKR